MQPRKEFVTNYRARNIYKVVDGTGNVLYIAEPAWNGPIVMMSTKTADTLECLYKRIDEESLFTKLHPIKVR